MNTARLLSHFRIDKPVRFRLAARDCAETCGLDMDKDDAKAALKDDLEKLTHLQSRLYAHNRWAVLMIFQGIDAAGKDSAIKHVMSGINPQGCEVTSFKAPSAEELDHDFMWRHAVKLPTRGRIGIFNRSYYEEVLVVRVHPEILAAENLPEEVAEDDTIWKRRYRSIVDHERHLHANGTRIIKFFLHLSRDEQRERFLDRIDTPDKNWKFSTGDIEERRYWDDYQKAYANALSATSTGDAPWYVLPADDKKNARLYVSRIIVDALEKLDIAFPELTDEERTEMLTAREKLVAD